MPRKTDQQVEEEFFGVTDEITPETVINFPVMLTRGDFIRRRVQELHFFDRMLVSGELNSKESIVDTREGWDNAFRTWLEQFLCGVPRRMETQDPTTE